MLVASGVDWTNVLVALIAGVPAIIAAIGVLFVHGQVKTPSGKSIGAQVEDALHVALANNLHINAVSSKVDAAIPPGAVVEETKVPGLVEANGTTAAGAT